MLTPCIPVIRLAGRPPLRLTVALELAPTSALASGMPRTSALAVAVGLALLDRTAAETSTVSAVIVTFLAIVVVVDQLMLTVSSAVAVPMPIDVASAEGVVVLDEILAEMATTLAKMVAFAWTSASVVLPIE